MNNHFAVSHHNNRTLSVNRPQPPVQGNNPNLRDYIISFCAYIAMLIMLGFVIAAETNAFSL
ncbi:hypothetical protein [Paenochrobactrum glaciei]|uniref:Uncharacterized protein n=1 Tax=Paenochrobactrum glaciei TaxID=486407 RepID=A0ABP3RAB8_9HYPH